MFKLPHNCTHLTHYKVMLKILQARLHQHMNWELPDVPAGFRKGRGTRDQIANIHWIRKRKSSRKTSTSASLTMLNPLCGSQQAVEDALIGQMVWYSLLLRSLYAGQGAIVRTKHGTMDGSKLGKEYIKAVYCHPECLTYMKSTSCEMPGWMKHKLESQLPGEISITSDMPRLWHKVKRNWGA